MPWLGSKAASVETKVEELLEVSEVHPEVISFLTAVFTTGNEFDNIVSRLTRTQVPDSFERGDLWKINMVLDPKFLTDDILRNEPLALSQLRIRKLRSAATKLARKAPQLLDEVLELAAPSLLSNLTLEKSQSSPNVLATPNDAGNAADNSLSRKSNAAPPLPGIAQGKELPGTGTVVVDDFDRLKMIALYEAKNPTKVGEVDELLLKYAGNHAALFGKLKEKYGAKAFAAAEKKARKDKDKLAAEAKPQSTITSKATTKSKEAVPSTHPAPSRILHHAKTAPNLGAIVAGGFDRLKMIALYEAQNPTKVDEVDGLLKKYEGKHAAVFAKLEQKYGAEALEEAERTAIFLTKKQSRKVKPPPIQADIAVKDQITLPASPFSATFSFKTGSLEKQLRHQPSFHRMHSLPTTEVATAGLTAAWKVFAKAGFEGDEMNFDTHRNADENRRADEKTISTKLNALWQMDDSSMAELNKMTELRAKHELPLDKFMIKAKRDLFMEARKVFISEEKALEKAAEDAYEKYIGNSVENTAAAQRHRMKRRKQLDQKHTAENANKD